ncbi:MAG: hypothetical protein JO011_18185 [Ktedonobacteraceae bacterium]|nr:hypothetical protein [Ktedonobacteraceae bacterium]
MSDHRNGQVQQEEQSRAHQFNPNEHLMQLKSKEGPKDYLPVQWRLVWFREQCPNGTIDTEELEVDLDREVEEEVYVWNSEKRRSEKTVRRAKGYARYKAIVTDGKGGRSTGTKSENAASFPDYIEKAETGAIGRALAGLGYGTQFAPDLNEAHRIVDSPVERNVPLINGNGSTSFAPVRPNVVNHNGNASGSSEIHSAATENASDALLTDQQLSSIRKLCEHLGRSEPDNVTSITYLNAKKLIQQLTAEYREYKQGNKAS